MSEHTYQVQPGDTLAKIAQRELGDAMRWLEIYQANKAAMDRAYERAKPELRRIKATAIRHPSDYLSPQQQIIIPWK
jgi:nucleoid-associated protein YgaU